MPRKPGGQQDRRNPSGKTSVELVPQPHGGALLSGGVPGHAGGAGRPPSLVRARLSGSFAERIEVLEEIADGTPVETIEVPMGALLPHVSCPRCGDNLRSDKHARDVTVTVRRSARPGDRTKALDVMARYSIGAVRGVSDAELDAFMKQCAEAVFEICGAEVFQRVSARLAEIRHPHDDAA